MGGDGYGTHSIGPKLLCNVKNGNVADRYLQIVFYMVFLHAKYIEKRYRKKINDVLYI